MLWEDVVFSSCSRGTPIVWKWGGSLLRNPLLCERVGKTLREQAGLRPTYVVAGGGAVADVVRHWDATFQLGDEASHALALRALDLTAELVHALLPGSQILSDAALQSALGKAFGIVALGESLDSVAMGRVMILPVRTFCDRYEELRPPSSSSAWPRIPQTWEMTSDSLAALAARVLRAELVLVKSVSLPVEGSDGDDVKSAVTQEAVDSQFAQFSVDLVGCHWWNPAVDPAPRPMRRTMRS